jgi:hypothetical protein
MHLRIASVALCAIVVSGCSTLGLSIANTRTCDNVPAGPPKLIVINVREDRKNPGNIENPGRSCARPGDILWFKIKENNRNASVVDKDDPSEWLKGNSVEKRPWFFVMVPHDVLEEGEDEAIFEYEISLDGFPDLDPEVRVRRSF